MKKIIVSIIVIGMLMTTSIVTVNAQINPYQGEIAIDDPIYVDGNGDYTPRGSISIDGNDEFNENNGVTGGSGTVVDPYIIEDWKLPGISILDTTAYFVIRHCYLTEVDEYPYDNYEGVHLKNVKNGAIQESIVHPEKEPNNDGISLVENSNSNVINSCIISNCRSEGIMLRDSNDNVIDNCTISGTWGGIKLTYSNNNTIHNCTISHSVQYQSGIHLGYSNDNIISNCEISKCYWGIELGGSSNNIIYSCNVSECSGGGGIELTKNREVFSKDNIIYHNNFFENYFMTDPLKIRCNAVVLWEGCLNQWDNGEEGNYWDDYHGLDLDGDGIGDTPYIILDGLRHWIPRGGRTGNRDRYPLMGPHPDAYAYPYNNNQNIQSQPSNLQSTPSSQTTEEQSTPSGTEGSSTPASR